MVASEKSSTMSSDAMQFSGSPSLSEVPKDVAINPRFSGYSPKSQQQLEKEEEERQARLRELRRRIRNEPSMPIYEPADGCRTLARFGHYQECRIRARKQNLVYDVVPHVLCKRSPRASGGGSADSDDGERRSVSHEIHSFRLLYRKSLENGNDKLDPWLEKGASVPRELWYPLLGANARDDYKMENGFKKLYRELPIWKDMDFDQVELAPEETAADTVAEAWSAAYKARRSSTRRVCFQLQHGASDVAHAVEGWKHKQLAHHEQVSSGSVVEG